MRWEGKLAWLGIRRFEWMKGECDELMLEVGMGTDHALVMIIYCPNKKVWFFYHMSGLLTDLVVFQSNIITLSYH